MNLVDTLERERAENTELRTRLQRIESQYNAYIGGEREIMELNEKLERDVKDLQHELEKARETVARDREQNENYLAQGRASWIEEKCVLHSRIEDLDVQLAGALKKLSLAASTYKQVS